MTTAAESIVEKIIDELDSRGEFDNWWGNLSEEIILEIKEKLAIIVENGESVIEQILNELDSRNGFDGWWGYIDADVQDEIKAALEEIL